MKSFLKSRAGAVFFAVMIAAGLLLFYFHWTDLADASSLVGVIGILICFLLIMTLALLILGRTDRGKQDTPLERTKQ